MIAFLTLELRIEAAQSLKDKRQVVRSLKDRLRAHFNVAVAELDADGLWNRATLGVVSVCSVVIAEDARSARVFVNVEGDEGEAERTLEGLMAAGGFIRRAVAERLHLRRPPELVFQLDRSQQYGSRINELL